jgi:vancomycin resistance protein VanJ
MTGCIVMTYNLADHLTPPQRLVAALNTSDADIIALEELGEPQANALRESLIERYPYQILYGEGIRGKGILSRYPILHSERLLFYPRRPDLLARLDVEGQTLCVIVAHPPPPRLQRRGLYFTRRTVRQLIRLAHLAVTDEPTVLMGDFNMSARHSHYGALIRSGLVDAFREAGQGTGYTIPRRAGQIYMIPIARIDYIFHSKHLKADRAWIGPDAGSDHLPVLAQLHWV